MENYIENIELINSYLNKRLSESEIQTFENRLKTDSSFNTLFDEHTVFLEGIKRQQLKADIVKAKQAYVKAKWFKFLGIISSGLIILFAVVYFNVFNSDKEYLKDKLNFESEFVQNFHVAIDSVIEIVGKKGTVIKFNPKDLETSLGKLFIGDSLKIELIELTTKQDLLFANAQTISDGKWLISGGAFKIDITANGEPLVLKEGKTIVAKFPKNTSEDGMEIFYGERDKEGKMNWDVSKINLEDEEYYTVMFKDSSIIDFVLSKRFGVDMFRDIALVDTLGYLSYKNIVEEFPEMEDIKIDRDTLRIGWVPFYKYKYSEINSLINDKVGVYENEYVILSKEEVREMLGKSDSIIDDIDFPEREYRIKLFSKKEFEDIINDNRIILEQAKVENKLFKFTNNFYETVELSKLGWINIDKFAGDEETVKIKLEFNVNTSFNEIYIVDQKNNTILNVYNDEVDLPINRSFYIISLGIKGKDIYGFKKSFRFNKKDACKIEYKKINEKQLKSLLTLQNSIGDVIQTSIKTDESIILKDSISPKTEVVKVEDLKPIKVIETSFKKTPQKLKINTQKDTTIVCKEGTKLNVKANSFVDNKGNLVNGTIDLNVTEYYKLSDMLLTNLSTASNGKQLETGGMLFIEAKKEGTDLELKENSSIEVLFPTKNKKKDMQLFSGEWDNDIINWSLEDNSTSESIELDEIDENIDVPFAVVEQVPVYPNCENLEKEQQRQCTSDAIQKFVQRNFETNIASAIGLTGRRRINTIFKINKYGNVVSIRSRANHPILEKEANRVIALLPKMKPGKQRGKAVSVPYSLPIIFTVSGDRQDVSARIGNLNSIAQVKMDTIYTSVRGEVESIREVMHDKDFVVDSTFIKSWNIYTKDNLIRFFGENNVILRKSLFEMENTRFKVLDDDSISRGGHIIRKLWNESQVPTTSIRMRLVPNFDSRFQEQDSIINKRFEDRMTIGNNFSALDVNNYILRSSQLGWINCDRFRRSKSRIKYKLKIKNSEGTIVNMVFKEINSVMPSWKYGEVYDFRTVPKDGDIILIAIKKNEGKLYLDVIETKTQENPSLEFNFKEVSLSELKKQLIKMDELF